MPQESKNIFPFVKSQKRYEWNTYKTKLLYKNSRFHNKPFCANNSSKSFPSQNITRNSIMTDFGSMQFKNSRTKSVLRSNINIRKTKEYQKERMRWNLRNCRMKKLNAGYESINFVSEKKLNKEFEIEKYRTNDFNFEDRLISWPKNYSSQHIPKLVLCNEEGSTLHKLALEDFLKNQCNNIVTDYFTNMNKFIFKRNSETRDKLFCNTEVNQLSNDRSHKPMNLTNKNFNKIMKKLDLKHKNFILQRIGKIMPDKSVNNVKYLPGLVEIMEDNKNNIVIKMKKRNPLHRDVSSTSQRKSFIRNRESDFNEMSDKTIENLMKVKKDKEHISYINKCKRKSNSINYTIDEAISLINKFYLLTFKNNNSELKIMEIMKMAKIMNLNLTKENIRLESFKKKEFVYCLKREISQYLSSVINSSNNIEITNDSNFPYKHYIEKENNGILVKSILKQRPWWHISFKHDESLNFIWTQWFKNKYTSKLPCLGNDTEERIMKIVNHLEGHYNLSNKKTMFANMVKYYKENNKEPRLM